MACMPLKLQSENSTVKTLSLILNRHDVYFVVYPLSLAVG